MYGVFFDFQCNYLPRLKLYKHRLSKGMKNQRKQRLIYIVFDFFAAMAAWVLFFLFRKIYIEPQVFGTDVPLTFGERFWFGALGLPFAWLLLYSSFCCSMTLA